MLQRRSILDVVHDLAWTDLPDEAAAQAERCLLDLAGVAAAGARTELARVARNFAARQLAASQGGAPLLLDGRRASPSGAAYAGAALLDSFDAHDGHPLTKGHIGVVVLPTILAVADSGIEIEGRELLACLVLGYEIATRAGIALHATACDYHTSGAWNALGCAAVAARLLGLSRAATREALGIAEYHGPRSQMMRCIDHPTMLKDGSAWGALAGVSAAYLAADGFTGAPAVTLEAPEVAGIWDDLGSRWRILEQYFKPDPVCRWAQPAIEAALDLQRRHGFRAGDIESVMVRTFAEAVRLATAVPRTTEEAQYSLPFPVAAALVRGRIGVEEITAEGLADPAIQSLSRRVAPVEEPEFSRRFPAERLAIVEVALADGRRFVSEPTVARGNPENPLSDAELRAKFRGLTAWLGAERAARIEAEVASLRSKARR